MTTKTGTPAPLTAEQRARNLARQAARLASPTLNNSHRLYAHLHGWRWCDHSFYDQQKPR